MRRFRVCYSKSTTYVANIFSWPLICINRNSKLNDESKNRYTDIDDSQADTASLLKKKTNGTYRSGYLYNFAYWPVRIHTDDHHIVDDDGDGDCEQPKMV